MRFSVNQTEGNEGSLLVLRDEVAGTEARVMPDPGALLHHYSIPLNGSPFNVIDNYSGQEEAKKEIGLSYKSAKLSPFPCRIPEGKYSFNNHQYQLKNKFLDGSAIHGLLYNKPFTLIDHFADSNAAAAVLEYKYLKDDDQYPFDYTCQVTYKLEKDHQLEITTRVTNNSRLAIPMADGWHPYFQLAGKADQWMLWFDSGQMVEFDDKLIPTGKIASYKRFQNLEVLGQEFLDNCFVLRASSNGPVCELFNPENKLKISFYNLGSYRYLQVYTPPHRKSIAIENLSSAPDAFNNKMGLLLLGPGESQRFSLRYCLALG
jgi:aldose 1-epimerase